MSSALFECMQSLTLSSSLSRKSRLKALKSRTSRMTTAQSHASLYQRRQEGGSFMTIINAALPCPVSKSKGLIQCNTFAPLSHQIHQRAEAAEPGSLQGESPSSVQPGAAFKTITRRRTEGQRRLRWAPDSQRCPDTAASVSMIGWLGSRRGASFH